MRPLHVGWDAASSPGPWSDELAAAASAGGMICERRFTFLGETRPFDGPIPWQIDTVSRLWRFNLHYFDYVHDLIALGVRDAISRRRAFRCFADLVADWIEHNPPARGDGWHPYTVSLRLVNWIAAYLHFADDLRDDDLESRLFDSIARQARYLDRNLELDVRGNHLIANLRALLLCGAFFAGPEPARWRERGLRLLEYEVTEQVLPDGGHFERSPGYHAVVLEHLLEVALWLERNGPGVPAWLGDAIARMLDYLLGILPPAGALPRLKDTAWDAAPRPSDVLAAGALHLVQPRLKRSAHFGLGALRLFGRAGWETFRTWPPDAAAIPSAAYRAIDHYVMRDDARGDYLIFDAGKPCPDYLPGHAHADLLSYELTVGGYPIVVDSGVYEYTAGPWRSYFRSTRAHSTVEVGGHDQSEVWGSFRVARRARPGPVHWQTRADVVLVQGQHDGYRRLIPPVHHRRTLVWVMRQLWLVVDELLGSGPTAAACHIHLHPALEPRATAASTWKLQGVPVPLWIRAAGHTGHALARGQREPIPQGWYSERFGDLRPNPVLSLAWRGDLSGCLVYVISLDTPADLRRDRVDDGWRVSVRHRDRHWLLHLPPDGAPTFERFLAPSGPT